MTAPQDLEFGLAEWDVVEPWQRLNAEANLRSEAEPHRVVEHGAGRPWEKHSWGWACHTCGPLAVGSGHATEAEAQAALDAHVTGGHVVDDPF